jgi:hypothetical protein
MTDLDLPQTSDYYKWEGIERIITVSVGIDLEANLQRKRTPREYEGEEEKSYLMCIIGCLRMSINFSGFISLPQE